MPGLVKIGLTTNKPSKRADELYTTGVPANFTVVRSWPVPQQDLRKIEAAIHSQLEQYRYSRRREFFEIEASEAVAFIGRYLKRHRVSTNGDMSEMERWSLLGLVLLFFLGLITVFS